MLDVLKKKKNSRAPKKPKSHRLHKEMPIWTWQLPNSAQAMAPMPNEPLGNSGLLNPEWLRIHSICKPFGFACFSFETWRYSWILNLQAHQSIHFHAMCLLLIVSQSHFNQNQNQMFLLGGLPKDRAKFQSSLWGLRSRMSTNKS